MISCCRGPQERSTSGERSPFCLVLSGELSCFSGLTQFGDVTACNTDVCPRPPGIAHSFRFPCPSRGSHLATAMAAKIPIRKNLKDPLPRLLTAALQVSPSTLVTNSCCFLGRPLWSRPAKRCRHRRQYARLHPWNDLHGRKRLHRDNRSPGLSQKGLSRQRRVCRELALRLRHLLHRRQRQYRRQ